MKNLALTGFSIWFLFWILVFLLIWMDSFNNDRVSEYIAACSKQNGFVVEARILNNRHWIQCVRGLEIIKLKGDEALQ